MRAVVLIVLALTLSAQGADTDLLGNPLPESAGQKPTDADVEKLSPEDAKAKADELMQLAKAEAQRAVKIAKEFKWQARSNGCPFPLHQLLSMEVSYTARRKPGEDFAAKFSNSEALNSAKKINGLRDKAAALLRSTGANAVADNNADWIIENGDRPDISAAKAEAKVAVRLAKEFQAKNPKDEYPIERVLENGITARTNNFDVAASVEKIKDLLVDAPLVLKKKPKKGDPEPTGARKLTLWILENGR